MALNSVILTKDIYDRIAFRHFSGRSEPGLKDKLREEAGVKEVDSSIAPDVRIADIYDEGLAEILAEEILEHFRNYSGYLPQNTDGTVVQWYDYVTYNLNAVVSYNGVLYASRYNDNRNNNPTGYQWRALAELSPGAGSQIVSRPGISPTFIVSSTTWGTIGSGTFRSDGGDYVFICNVGAYSGGGSGDYDIRLLFTKSGESDITTAVSPIFFNVGNSHQGYSAHFLVGSGMAFGDWTCSFQVRKISGTGDWTQNTSDYAYVAAIPTTGIKGEPGEPGLAATWESSITYSIDDVASEGQAIYQSLQDNNTGNEPSTSPTYWGKLAFELLSVAEYENAGFIHAGSFFPLDPAEQTARDATAFLISNLTTSWSEVDVSSLLPVSLQTGFHIVRFYIFIEGGGTLESYILATIPGDNYFGGDPSRTQIGYRLSRLKVANHGDGVQSQYGDEFDVAIYNGKIKFAAYDTTLWDVDTISGRLRGFYAPAGVKGDRGEKGEPGEITASGTNGDFSVPGDLTVGGAMIGTAGGTIIEQISTQANGRIVSVISGDYTIEDVTAHQDLTTTHTKVNGSRITYNPPTGTSRVEYEFHFHWYASGSSGALYHMSLWVDGQEVIVSRQTEIDRYADSNKKGVYRFTIEVGDTDDISNGILGPWTTDKVLELRAREYNSTSWSTTLHKLQWWDGTTVATVARPNLKIAAIS